MYVDSSFTILTFNLLALRWLNRRQFNIRSARNLYALLDITNNNNIFTPFQLARNFNKNIYTSCPWFLEYKEGKFPSNEELQHNNAVKEREERAQRVLHSESSIAPVQPIPGDSSIRDKASGGNVSSSRVCILCFIYALGLYSLCSIY